MLRESSTSTAMMFCCGFSSATVMAGCHSSRSTTRRQQRLQQPDHAGAPVPHIGAAACGKRAADQQRQPGRRRQHQQNQNPLRPGAEQHELALRKNRRRILEEKFKHSQPFHPRLATNSNARNTSVDATTKLFRMRGPSPECCLRSVRHSVNDVVEPDAKSHRRKVLRILRDRPPIPRRRQDACCGRWPRSMRPLSSRIARHFGT